MTKLQTMSALIELIARNAERLREAGVSRFRLESIEVDLLPSVPREIDFGEVRAELQRDFSDPLQDPTTYGRRDGMLPGFERLISRQELEDE